MELRLSGGGPASSGEAPVTAQAGSVTAPVRRPERAGGQLRRSVIRSEIQGIEGRHRGLGKSSSLPAEIARIAGAAAAMVLLQTLSLLVLTAGALGAGTQMVGVQVPTQVQGFLGKSVTLSCRLQPPPGASIQMSQITWMKQGAEQSIAVFHPVQGFFYQDPKRMKFLAVEQGTNLPDASLELSALGIEDEANYTCSYAVFPQGSGSASTWLQVVAPPNISASALQAPPPLCCVSSSGHPTTSAPADCVSWEASLSSTPAPPLRGPCVFPWELPAGSAPAPVPVVQCQAHGGRPPARLSWSTHLNGTTTSTRVPGPQPGTVSVISLFSAVPSSRVDGKVVTCVVEHQTLEEPLLVPVNVTAHYPPEVSITGYDYNWFIGRPEVTLNCHIQSNPKYTHFNWTTTSGTLPRSAQVQGTQLHITIVDEAINTTFICSATNAMGTGQGKETIILGERPPASMSPTVIVIMVVVTVLALILGLLLYLRQQKHCQQACSPLHVCCVPGWQQSDTHANGDVSHSPVSEEAIPLRDTTSQLPVTASPAPRDSVTSPDTPQHVP
ncbi:poliovirus receptor homolog [Perognathus longimembris pacificus]|uniref:poliovirus receptor homolog n=1 Tax=Perognathus longimembris pacificus TaxID=214514 RepID=UPI002019E951|nr:poliovirus receptor homolog [Perognathus longimembris pacificus]